MLRFRYYAFEDAHFESYIGIDHRRGEPVQGRLSKRLERHGPMLAELTGIGAVLSETSNVIVLAGANLATKRSQVESLFSRRTDEEMEDLVFVPEMKL